MASGCEDRQVSATTALPQVAFLASPLLGPAVWRSAAGALADLGWRVLVVPGLAGAPTSPAEVLKHLLGCLSAGPALALVAHSNAGLYLPTLSAECEVVANVYADAALPAAVGPTPMAPPPMLDMLKQLVDDDGLLPPWTEWWNADELASLLPDAASRAAVVADQQRLPMTYFTATIEAPVGWTTKPAAYLAFGDTYEAERDQATRWGWPVKTLNGGHLHPLVAPESVAKALNQLLRRQLDRPAR
jgi:hypothetical protein